MPVTSRIVETAGVAAEATAGGSADHLTSPGAALGTVDVSSTHRTDIGSHLSAAARECTRM